MLFLLRCRSLSLYTVFPSQLHALSVALSLIIPIQCVFPSYLPPLFVALLLIIPVQCVFPSHLLAFFYPFLSQYPCTLSFLAIFFLFFLHSCSVSRYVRSFLAICIFTLLLCCSYSLNSASDLARLFHSVLYCCLISLTDFSLHISLAAPCTLWLSLYFFLALSAKSFCDCKFLSTIACASEGTFGESTAAQFLLDDSPHLTSTTSHRDYHLIYVPLFYSVCSIFQHIFSFCLPRSHLSPSHLFYELYQVSVAAWHFFS